MKVLCLLAGLLFFTVAAADTKVYRWVDRNGQVHFGQIPPTSGPYETLTTESSDPPPAEEAKAASEAMASDTRRFLEQAEAANRAKAEEKAKAQQVRQERARKCDEARERVKFLEERTARRLVTTDVDGELQRIPEDEFLRRLGAAQKIMETHCR